MVEDFQRRAWVDYLEKGASGPLQVTMGDGDTAIVQLLLNEIS